MILERSITAFFMLTAVVLLVWFAPPHVFFIASLGVYALALFEVCALVGIQSKTWSGCLTAMGILLSIFCYVSVPIEWVALIALFYWALMMVALLFYLNFPYVLTGVQYLCGFIAYFALLLMWIALNWLRLHWSPSHLLALLAFVSIVDIGGYLGGHCWGRHPLALSVSPGKTVEGAITALLLSLLYGGSLMLFAYHRTHWLFLLGMVVLALMAIVGDLVESMLKRMMQMKDSGTCLPGHGGILDRIDGYAAVLPMALFFYLLATHAFFGLNWLEIKHFVG